MQAFATVTDLQAGWRTLSSDEQETAETLLKRATAQLAALLRRNNIQIDESDRIQVQNLSTVTCNMVRRVMDAPGSITSIAQGVGSTNATVSFSNPDSSLYLSKTDREILGLIGKSRYRCVSASTIFDESR